MPEQKKSNPIEIPRDERLEARADIFDQLRDGKFTPDQAEQEAKRRGCGPLRTHPDHQKFDPAKLPTWTLPMALAWIATRDMDRVCEAWDDYRDQCWIFKPIEAALPPESADADEVESNSGASREAVRRMRDWDDRREISGYELVQLPKVTWSYLRTRLAEIYEGTDKFNLAKAALWSALQDGRVVALGRESGQATNAIPSESWAIFEPLDHFGAARIGEGGVTPIFPYDSVCMSRHAVLGAWPQTLKERRDLAIKKCRAWLVSIMAPNPDNPQPQSDFVDEAKSKFGLSERDFKNQWTPASDEANAPAWSAAGRRKRRARE